NLSDDVATQLSILTGGAQDLPIQVTFLQPSVRTFATSLAADPTFPHPPFGPAQDQFLLDDFKTLSGSLSSCSLGPPSTGPSFATARPIRPSPRRDRPRPWPNAASFVIRSIPRFTPTSPEAAHRSASAFG